jgi:hypothetical protein
MDAATSGLNRVLKYKHPAVSQGDDGWRLGGWNARRLKKAQTVFLQASQPPIV